jgi:thiamine-phosphate pyrophosphorylase
MRPLPRLHAITTEAVLARTDLGIRAAALAAAGPAVALHARGHSLSGAALAGVVTRFLSLAGPPEASVFVNGRADVARALGAQGLHLGASDYSVPDARRVLGAEWHGWVGRSVHSVEAAVQAKEEAADYVIAGNVFETSSHPGRPAQGLEFVTRVARVGLPVIAIGGITAERAPLVREAGAYGVAAVTALWEAGDCAAAAVDLLRSWTEAEP